MTLQRTRSDSVTDAREYRIPRFYLLLGFGSALFAGAGLVAGISGEIWNRPAPSPVAATVIYFGIYIFFLSLSTWILLAYFQERLIISDGRVSLRGVLKGRAMDLADVQQARWRIWPGRGNLVLQSRDARLVIPFFPWHDSDRQEMVEYLRGALPADNQEGWPEFEEQMCPWRHPGGYGDPRSWRSRVPFTVAILMIGIFCLVFAPFAPANLAYGIAFTGLVNLTAGWYFARGILRQRRAEREAESS
jgi:hypothetical protein